MSQDAHESANDVSIHGYGYSGNRISEINTSIKLLEHARAFIRGGNLKLASQGVATVRNRLNLLLRDMEK